jgi:hypothetical protein
MFVCRIQRQCLLVGCLSCFRVTAHLISLGEAVESVRRRGIFLGSEGEHFDRIGGLAVAVQYFVTKYIEFCLR